MDNLKKQYESISLEMKNIVEQIDNMKNNDAVKKYFDLCNQKEILKNKKSNLYKQIKFEDYLMCNHIWVNTLNISDSREGRLYNYFGCIKCGLNENVFHLKDIYNDLSYFTDEQQIMYDFMKNHHYHLGINTKMFCELDLARAIYSKIIEAHPNIDDETVRKYFEISLNNIRKFKVDDERKNNVAKRLSLNPKSIR